MKRRRHHGAQKECRIVHGRVGEDVLLDDQGTAADRLQSDIVQWGEGCRSGGNRVAQSLGCDIPRREVLCIIESDDLWPQPGQQVVFELYGNIDRGDGLAGADRPSGGRQAFAALADAQPWRRRDLLDDPR